jgi:hypothetical protein
MSDSSARAPPVPYATSVLTSLPWSSHLPNVGGNHVLILSLAPPVVANLLLLAVDSNAAPGVVNLDPNGVINLINAVIGWGQRLGTAVGALALMFAGYQFLMAWGSTRSLQGATESVKFGIVGLVLVLACYVVPNLLQAAASAAPASS